MTTQTVLIGCNDRGYRVGASHPKARITDQLVAHLRDLHEGQGVGTQRLALLFDLPQGTVRKIIYYERRLQTATRWKRVEVPNGTTS